MGSIASVNNLAFASLKAAADAGLMPKDMHEKHANIDFPPSIPVSAYD